MNHRVDEYGAAHFLVIAALLLAIGATIFFLFTSCAGERFRNPQHIEEKR